VISIHSMSKKT